MESRLKDISKEWVGAPVTSALCERKEAVVKETFTPSGRVLRSRTRTIAGTQEVQASDEKSVTVNINGSTKKSDYNEANSGLFENPQTQSRRKYTRKMSSSSIQPEQPHRVARNSTSAQLPLSLDSGLKDDHTPAPNDKIWKNIDKELEKLIPENFNKKLMNNLLTSEISQQFDTWLHNFFLEHFGKKEPKEFNTLSFIPLSFFID